MHLLWIRHAQSVNNAGENDPTYEHQPDAPLTDLGRQQAQHLADALYAAQQDSAQQAQLDANPALPIYRVDQLYSSPMRRSLQTAKPISAALKLPVTVLLDVFEYGGAYQLVTDASGRSQYVGKAGLTRAEMQALVPGVQLPSAVTDAGWWTPEQGFESDEAYFARAHRFAAFLREQAQGDWRGKWIAVVSHADFTNFLLKLLLVADIEDHPQAVSFIYPYNTSITRLDFGPNAYPIMRSMGRIDHLPVDMVSF
jgi:broad specificity phosphatase PhoE